MWGRPGGAIKPVFSLEMADFRQPLIPGVLNTRGVLAATSQRLQSAVMPASLTTLAHNATSALIISENCEGGAPLGSQPAVSSFSCTSGVASAAPSALLIRATIG